MDDATGRELSERDLQDTLRRADNALPGPWITPPVVGDLPAEAGLIVVGSVESPDTWLRLVRDSPVERDERLARWSTRNDAALVAHARQDIPVLVDLILRVRGLGGGTPTAGAIAALREEAGPLIAAVEGRLRNASPGPWRVMLASFAAFTGETVIWVGDDRSLDPDMYVVLERAGKAREMASDADYTFIAELRQDLPRIVADLRLLLGL